MNPAASLLVLLLALCGAAGGAEAHAATGASGAKVFKAPPGGWPQHPETGDQRCAVTGIDDPAAYYLLAVPADYTPEKEYPLWVVLHGSHAQPKDMASVFKNGLTQRGVISVYPNSLNRHQQMLEWNYPDSGMYLLAIVRDVAAKYHVDPKRIYLAGHSMGGGGTWTMGAVLNDLWAGIAPLSGWYASTPRPDPKWLGSVPIYIIHGDQDQNVLVENSRMAVKALTALGRVAKTLVTRPEKDDFGKADIIYRELPGVGHIIFMPWAEQGAPEIGRLVAWLSAQTRAKPADFDAACARLVEWGKSFNWKPDGGPLGTFSP
jgi:poly(3-hydroxybutyrate) depolymerase